MNRVFQLTLAALLLVLLGACSSNKHAVKPADLVSFTKQVDVKTLWTELVGPGVDKDYLLLAPAITADVIYTANRNGLVVALNRAKGNKLWKARTKHRITGGLSSAYGQVFFGTIDGELVAIDASNGELQWKAQLSSEILSRPAIGSETVVAQTTDGQLFGLDRTNGTQLWQFDTDEPILTLRGASHPQIAGALVLAGFANGKLIAVDLESGEMVWERQISVVNGRSELERLVDVDSDFQVNDDVIYAVNYQGSVAALDVFTGRPYWSKDLSSHVATEESAGTLYVADAKGSVWALDSDTGVVRWQQDALSERKLSGPVVYKDYLVVGDFEGYLHWLDKETGQFKSRVRVDSEGVRSKPVIRESVLYVLGNSGRLSALSVSQ